LRSHKPACRDCPFPQCLPSAPPAPAPSPAPRLVTLAVTQAATAKPCCRLPPADPLRLLLCGGPAGVAGGAGRGAVHRHALHGCARAAVAQAARQLRPALPRRVWQAARQAHVACTAHAAHTPPAHLTPARRVLRAAGLAGLQLPARRAGARLPEALHLGWLSAHCRRRGRRQLSHRRRRRAARQVWPQPQPRSPAAAPRQPRVSPACSQLSPAPRSARYLNGLDPLRTLEVGGTRTRGAGTGGQGLGLGAGTRGWRSVAQCGPA
jgi:hypothetical protein